MTHTQRFTRLLVAVCTVGLSLTVLVGAQEQKFYPDDPLTAEPPPYPTVGP